MLRNDNRPNAYGVRAADLNALLAGQHFVNLQSMQSTKLLMSP